MSSAYACLISQEHMDAIRSEKPDFDLQEALIWVEEHGESFFVRDEDSPWDCKYISAMIFHQIYEFENFDPTAIFHRVVRS